MIPHRFWDGKSVIVTGGSSGIGRAVAIAVAASGGRVGIVSRHAERQRDTVEAIRAAGGTAAGEIADVAEMNDMARAVSAFERSLGSCDVAIACAGIHRISWPLDPVTATEVIDVNVKGCVHLAAAVLPAMLHRRRGHLCGIASIAGVVGLPGNAVYCASKAAIIAFLEGVRLDAGDSGIQVTTVLPGVVDTPMVTQAERDAGGLVSATEAARIILRSIERGRAEAWFPTRTAIAARAARSLPPLVRDWFLRRQPRLDEADGG